MAESKGFFRRTPVHLRVASLLDHVGKNSPPDCFLPQTASAPSLFESLCLFLPMQKAGLATCFSFWRRARDFFGALPCAFASLRSLTTSAKTVHRTVFFRRLRLLPPCSNPFVYFCQCKKQALRPAFRFGGEQGIRTLEQALTCYTISNRAPSASSDNSPNSFSLFN